MIDRICEIVIRVGLFVAGVCGLWIAVRYLVSR